MEWSCNCIAKQQKPLENTINQPIQKNIGTKTQETIGNNGNHKETISTNRIKLKTVETQKQRTVHCKYSAVPATEGATHTCHTWHSDLTRLCCAGRSTRFPRIEQERHRKFVMLPFPTRLHVNYGLNGERCISIACSLLCHVHKTKCIRSAGPRGQMRTSGLDAQ
jgi:hypothetical protein